jgi:hypothetical protein
MELLQKVGFNGQLKTDKNADTIAKTDQLVIHGASRDDQIKAFQVLKYYSEMCKNLSFIGTGFDYKDASTKKTKSFSQLLEDASYSGNVDFVNDLIQKLEAEFLANIEKYNVDYIARSGIDIPKITVPKIPDDFVNDEKWAEDEANEAIRELEERRKQLQQQGKLAGKEFGKAIEDGANDALGINSPSTVFQEIAHWCGEGFKVGLDKNGKVIYGSVAEWRDKLVAEFKSKQITDL